MRALILLLALLVAHPAAAACVDIRADGDWRALPGSGPILDAYAAGTWAVGERRRVGPGGYPNGGEAPRIAEAYPLGALLIANQARRVWSYRDFGRTVMGALLAGSRFAPGPLYARINHTPGADAGNSGAITLCLERAAD